MKLSLSRQGTGQDQWSWAWASRPRATQHNNPAIIDPEVDLHPLGPETPAEVEVELADTWADSHR